MCNVLHPTNDEFDELITNGLLLVDFYADRCAPCRALAPTVEELADEYDGKVSVAKIDVDGDGRELALEFGVTSIPTVIIFKDGDEINREIGLRPKEVYLQMLENSISLKNT